MKKTLRIYDAKDFEVGDVVVSTQDRNYGTTVEREVYNLPTRTGFYRNPKNDTYHLDIFGQWRWVGGEKHLALVYEPYSDTKRSKSYMETVGDLRFLD